MPEQSVDHLVQRLLEEPTSRRAFMARLAALGITVSGASTVLAACGGSGSTAKKGAEQLVASGNHPKTAIGDLTFSNWPLYIDKKTIPAFDKQFGAKVKYIEDINDNEEFFGKVRQQLAQGKAIDRDIVTLTDWMAARWIRLGYVEALDKRNIPNAKNLTTNLAAPTWDPERSYSLPWQSYITAIGYNPKKTGRKLSSVNDLLDPAFKGRVSFFSDARDSSSLMLFSLGIKPADAKIDDILKAIDKIDAANQKGQIRRFTGNDYTTDLTKGNLWVSMAFSGDIIQLQADNPDLEFLIPDEGAIIATDNMMIPKKAAHPYTAEVMMNYIYEPEVMAKIAAYVNYVPPVKGVKEVVAKTDPKTAANPLIFPSDAVLAKLSGYPNLTEDEERQMNERMQEVVGA